MSNEIKKHFKEDFTIANDHGVEILSVKSEEMLTPLKKEKRA